MNSVILSGGTIVTMDARRRVIRNGAVYVEDGLITAVGTKDEVKGRYRADKVINTENHVVVPGLIDSHVHTTHSLLRGLCSSLGLEDCLRHVVWPAQAVMEGDDAVSAAELCMLEMMTTGTTTFVEAGLHSRFRPDRIAFSVEKMGFRAILSKTIMDSPSASTNAGALNPEMAEEPEECFREVSRLLKGWSKPNSRVGFWLAPRALGIVSPKLFGEISRFSLENETGITMHLRESSKEVEFVLSNYGTTPVPFAQSVGVLGPRTLLAHMVDPDEQDITILRESGTAIAHCPTSNAQLASGYCPVPRLVEAGIRVGLGCDGASHNFVYDMFAEIRFASILHKVVGLDPTSMPAALALELATSGGARALGLQNRIGSIEVGKAADIITVDLNRPHIVPVIDPVSSLVYSCSGADVDNVMVDGKMLIEGRRVLSCDPESILRSARRSIDRITEKCGLKRA